METVNTKMNPIDLISNNHNGSSELLSLLIIGGLSSVTIGLTKVFIPLFALALNADEFQLGLTAAAMSIGMLLMSIPAGKLTSIWNVKYTFCTGLIFSIGIYFCFQFIQNAWFFLIAVIFLSATFPLRFVSLQKKFLALIKQVGSKSAGWLRATQMLGTFVLGPSLAGAYLGYGIVDDLPWIIIAILTACIVLGLLTSGLDMKPLTAIHIKNSTDESIEKIQTKILLHSAYAIEIAIAASMNIFNAFCVLLALNHYQLPASEGASLIIWQGVGFAGCLILGGRFISKFKLEVSQWLFLVITAIALTALTLTHNFWHAKALSLIIGISLAFLTLLNMNTFAQLSKDEASSRRIATMSIFMVPLGGMLGTILAGIAAHFLNVDAVYYIAALSAIAAAIFTYLLRQKFKHWMVNYG